jgi:hypothetical protein
MYITLEDVLIVCGQIGAILIISPFILYVVGVIVAFFNVIMEIYDELHKRYGNIVFYIPPIIGLIIIAISFGLQAIFGFL